MPQPRTLPNSDDLRAGHCFEFVLDEAKLTKLGDRRVRELTAYWKRLLRLAETQGYTVRRDVRFGLRSQVTHYRFEPPSWEERKCQDARRPEPESVAEYEVVRERQTV